MAEIKFSQEEKAQIVTKVKMYFREELGQEIGGFDAEFLIDFFASEVGALFINNRAIPRSHCSGVPVGDRPGAVLPQDDAG